MKKIIAILLVFISSSCNNERYSYTKYDNGKIHERCEVEHGIKNGECVEYGEDGNISSITNWKNGELTGEYYFFYQNGKLKETGRFEAGNKVGEIKYFTKTGKLDKIRKYILEDGKSFLNEVIVFKPNGDTNYQKSNFFELKTNKDTIDLDDTLKAIIMLKAPYFKNSKMFVYFEIPNDTTHYRRLYSDDYLVNYEYIPKKTGKYQLKGFIEEFITIDEDTVKKGKSRYMFFEKKFLVMP